MSRESDLRAERQQHAAPHGKNGSQAQHIRAWEQSKGDARGYIWIRPVGNGLLVAGLVVSTASSRLGLARAPMAGEGVGDADALDSTTIRTRQISQ